MTIFKLSIAALAALLAGAWAEQAKADETFVCAGGGLVHATPEDLPELKRTNPCVAAYFGLTVSAAAAADTAVPPQDQPRVLLSTASQPRAAIAPVERQTVANEVAPQIAPQPVQPRKPPSDHRNVHVLNGGNGSGSWYRPPH
jgi:hypothetical protein